MIFEGLFRTHIIRAGHFSRVEQSLMRSVVRLGHGKIVRKPRLVALKDCTDVLSEVTSGSLLSRRLEQAEAVGGLCITMFQTDLHLRRIDSEA
jgi:hypothetical protein